MLHFYPNKLLPPHNLFHDCNIKANSISVLFPYMQTFCISSFNLKPSSPAAFSELQTSKFLIFKPLDKFVKQKNPSIQFKMAADFQI